MLDVVIVGVVLVLAGLLIIIAEVTRSSKRSPGEVKGGAVVMVGPIPIIFGSDVRWASLVLVLAIVLVILAFVFFGVLV